MRVLKRYQCEICEEIYDHEEDAAKCEARGMEAPIFKVGDFVVTETTWGRFGWYDGLDSWVIKRDKSMHGPSSCAYSLIYVITAILPDVGFRADPHRLCYHLATKAMSGDRGYRHGYTFLRTHVGLHKVDVGLDGSDLIGQKANMLL